MGPGGVRTNPVITLKPHSLFTLLAFRFFADRSAARLQAATEDPWEVTTPHAGELNTPSDCPTPFPQHPSTLNPKPYFLEISQKKMAHLRSSHHALRRLLGQHQNPSADRITNSLLFTAQGLRFRKLEVILTTVKKEAFSSRAVKSLLFPPLAFGFDLNLGVLILLEEYRQIGQGWRYGEGSARVLQELLDAQIARRSQHRQVCVSCSRAAQGLILNFVCDFCIKLFHMNFLMSEYAEVKSSNSPTKS